MTNKEYTFKLLKRTPYKQVVYEWYNKSFANQPEMVFKYGTPEHIEFLEKRGWTLEDFLEERDQHEKQIIQRIDALLSRVNTLKGKS